MRTHRLDGGMSTLIPVKVGYEDMGLLIHIGAGDPTIRHSHTTIPPSSRAIDSGSPLGSWIFKDSHNRN